MLLPNYMQMLKNLTEDSLAQQYQLYLEHSNCKALCFKFSAFSEYIYIYIYLYIYKYIYIYI